MFETKRTGNCTGPMDVVIAESSRLILRHLRPTDAGALDRIFGDPEVMRRGDGVKNQNWVQEWILGYAGTHYAAWGFGMWAVVEKSSRELVGYCGLSRFANRCGADEAEIGYRLARGAWGRGLATEAVCAVRDYGLKTLRLPRLIAIIDPGNVGSIRVAEKAGFCYEREVMFDGYSYPDKTYVCAIARGERK